MSKDNLTKQERNPYAFSWHQLWLDMRYGKWKFGWDDRKPLPSLGGVVHIYYDWHHYGLRIWRFYVAID